MGQSICQVRNPASPMFPFSAHWPDHAAGQLPAGISRWLRMKIVGIFMYHHGSAQNIGQMKSPGQHSHVCLAVNGQQGRQVSRVDWMKRPGWIKVSTRVRIIHAAAISPCMDMEGKTARGRRLGQPCYVRHHQNTVPHLIEFHGAGDAALALYPGHGPGTSCGNSHTTTSPHSMQQAAH